MEVVSTALAPAAVGPYSAAIKERGYVYASGQIPLDPATGRLVDASFEEQVRQCLRNLKVVLEAGGSSLDGALKVTVYLTDLASLPRLNRVYAEYFCQNFPARCCVQVAALPLNAQVEIDAVATCT